MRIQVTGRVQGVWYRASARTEGQRLGLSGWVRNRLDGSVELEVQGDESKVLEMVAWCRRGPPAARVDSVDSEPIPVAPEAAGFVVRDSV